VVMRLTSVAERGDSVHCCNANIHQSQSESIGQDRMATGVTAFIPAGGSGEEAGLPHESVIRKRVWRTPKREICYFQDWKVQIVVAGRGVHA